MTTSRKGQAGGGNGGTPAKEGANGWGWLVLGLPRENFCRQAGVLGLGIFFWGTRDEAALRRLLQIPEDEQVGPVVSLGHPDIDPAMPARLPVDRRTVYFR